MNVIDMRIVRILTSVEDHGNTIEDPQYDSNYKGTHDMLPVVEYREPHEGEEELSCSH